ncbi:MAG: hypothetical protein ACRDY0_12265 [Acidimicrobiales bacterium]
MALFLLFVVVAVALGIVGVVVKGVLYLLLIGIAVFLADFLWIGVRLGKRRRRPVR